MRRFGAPVTRVGAAYSKAPVDRIANHVVVEVVALGFELPQEVVSLFNIVELKRTVAALARFPSRVGPDLEGIAAHDQRNVTVHGDQIGEVPAEMLGGLCAYAGTAAHG